MLGLIKNTARTFLKWIGLRRSAHWTRLFPADPALEPWMTQIIRRVRPFTLTSRQRVRALCSSVAYLERHGIAGDIAECGVWKGGSMMAVALSLLRLGSAARTLYLFDTFAGMSAPTTLDHDKHGRDAESFLRDQAVAQHLICPLEQVRANLLSTGYDPRRLVFVPGKVEDTLPAAAPRRIALLRLDTDWYESTYHELVHLYPRLAPGGVLIIDDYGHWQGARQAVDDYFAQHAVRLPLHAVGSSARILLKSA